MVYAQPRTRSRKWDVQNSLGFWDTKGSSNLGQTTRPSDSQQQQQQQQNKKRTCLIVDITFTADHGIKL